MKDLKLQNTFGAWKSLMKQMLPLILGLSLFMLLFSLFLQWQKEEGIFDLELVQWIFLIDLTLLPLAAIHGLFFLKYILAKKAVRPWLLVLLKLFVSILSVAILSSVLEAIYTSIGFVDDDFVQFGTTRLSPEWSNVIEYSFITFFLGLPIFIWQSRVESLRFKLSEKEIIEERLTQLKTAAELRSLQSRINPHFLFNAFNSITSLIHSDPDKAESMMIELSKLFRYSLNTNEQHLVPLADEIQMLDAYLKIEKIRFGENLDFSLEIDSELDSYSVPRFLLQPLVENIIKHVLAKQKQVKIKLKIKREKEGITIQLFDSGPEFPEEIHFGFGLQSSFEKLELLYANNHQIELISAPEKQVFIYLGPSSFE